MQEAKYKYAGYWPRMWAYNTDLLVLLVIFYACSWIISQDRVLYIICLVLTILYHAFFESSSLQATPGKMILKLKVISENGGKISFGHALIRFILKILSLAIFYIGFIMIGFTKKGQALHDILIKTLVVSSESEPL